MLGFKLIAVVGVLASANAVPDTNRMAVLVKRQLPGLEGLTGGSGGSGGGVVSNLLGGGKDGSGLLSSSLSLGDGEGGLLSSVTGSSTKAGLLSGVTGTGGKGGLLNSVTGPDGLLSSSSGLLSGTNGLVGKLGLGGGSGGLLGGILHERTDATEAVKEDGVLSSLTGSGGLLSSVTAGSGGGLLNSLGLGGITSGGILDGIIRERTLDDTLAPVTNLLGSDNDLVKRDDSSLGSLPIVSGPLGEQD